MPWQDGFEVHEGKGMRRCVEDLLFEFVRKGEEIAKEGKGGGFFDLRSDKIRTKVYGGGGGGSGCGRWW